MTIATNSVKAWVLASRPKTLGAISCPIIIGNVLAYYRGQFGWHCFALTFFCGIVLQILANVVNDYGDFIKGSDQEDRLGPPRAMQMGLLTTNVMKMGIVVLVGLSSVLGMALVFLGGPIIFVGGAIALLLCFAYTLGPMPLAYLGFAEIVIFLVFGPAAVLGSYFVQTTSISLDALVASISPGFLATALLLTNNLRDMVQDERNHKRTVAVRYGDAVARKLIITLLVMALIGPMLLVWFFSLPAMVVLACCALIIPFRHVTMIACDPISSRFNLMLVAIGKALYLFGIAFAAGLIYGS